MTKRSKYATLKVKLNSKGCIHSRLSALREFLIRHLSFIQSIELYRPPPSNEFLQELPAHSARCLEHLHLRHDPRSSNTMVLIKRLLDDPRCLKTSNIRCAVVDWGSKIFTTLSHLVLYFDGRTVTEPIPNFSMHSRGCHGKFVLHNVGCSFVTASNYIILLVRHWQFLMSLATSPSPEGT